MTLPKGYGAADALAAGRTTETFAAAARWVPLDPSNASPDQEPKPAAPPDGPAPGLPYPFELGRSMNGK
jgi:hypothetical protein